MSDIPQSVKFYAVLMLGVKTAVDAKELLSLIWQAASDHIHSGAGSNENLRSLLVDISCNRWECSSDGECPDCGCEDGEPHESSCLLGRVDAEIDATPIKIG